jgi:hypothetical protein
MGKPQSGEKNLTQVAVRLQTDAFKYWQNNFPDREQTVSGPWAYLHCQTHTTHLERAVQNKNAKELTK